MPHQTGQSNLNQNAAHQFGAHETMEAHEILTDIINGINQFQLYRPHVSDPQLAQMLDRHVQFAIKEYDNMVNYLSNQRGISPEIYQTRGMGQAKYGLRNPAPVSPNQAEPTIDDRDISSGMLSCHKSSAILCMTGALECADPQLRRMMVQCAVSCSEKAYETFQYMNQKGYYQVPTLARNTQATMINTYQPMGQDFANLPQNLGMSQGGINPAGTHPGVTLHS